MLLKFRNRPERRLQAVPLEGFRERHGLQARREHDACATEACPSLQRAQEARPPRMTVFAGPSTRGIFNCVGAASLSRLRLPLRDASNSASNRQAKQPEASRDMTGSAGYPARPRGSRRAGSGEEGAFPLLS